MPWQPCGRASPLAIRLAEPRAFTQAIAGWAYRQVDPVGSCPSAASGSSCATHERSPAKSTVRLPFTMTSNWWSGQADVHTLSPAELVATKIRAL
jgi:hypothetical protein